MESQNETKPETKYKIYKLSSKDHSYYGRTKLKPNLCFNLLYCYYLQRKYVYDVIFDSKDYKFEIIFESDDKKDIKSKYIEYKKADPKCINYMSKVINKPNDELKEEEKPILKEEEKPKAKYIVSKEKMKEYNKRSYAKLKESGKYNKYYQENKQKIKEINKKRYNEMKEKLKKYEEKEKAIETK